MNGPCPNMQERIADAVLGALEAPEAQAVEEHLATCPACRAYARALGQQGEALTALGRRLAAEMPARRDRAIAALEDATVEPVLPERTQPWVVRLVPLAAAALVVLTVGIAIGRLTAPAPIDVEQLRADLQASVTESLQGPLRQAVWTDVDQRLETALAAGDEQLKTEIVELMREDLRTFAVDVVANSEKVIERRLTDFAQQVESARLADRQRVVRAFEQVELSRRRDRMQIGRGFQSLAALTGAVPGATEQ